MKSRMTALAMALCAGMAAADGAPRFGLSDPDMSARFTAELQEILDRVAGEEPLERDVEVPPPHIDRALDGDPQLRAAYRSDPKSTLALIRRIIDAGGLQE